MDKEAFGALYDDHEEYVARRDDASFHARQIILEVARFKVPNLRAVLPSDVEYESVVEVGCATGDLLAAFPAVRPGARCRKLGFDISRRNIEAASARYPEIGFSAEDIFVTAARADIVILSDVIEHVPDDVGFLRAASKVAKTMLLNIPLEDNWLNDKRQYGMNDSSGHLRRYSLDNALRVVIAAGLNPIRQHRVWAHETDYDLERRRLREELLGHAHGGSFPVRLAKAGLYWTARGIRPFGRRLFPSSLFLSAVREG